MGVPLLLFFRRLLQLRLQRHDRPKVATVMWNYRSLDELEEVGMGWLGDGWSEQPGFSTSLRDGSGVFHTYSAYARGAESLGGS
jgi:hypothetical protein